MSAASANNQWIESYLEALLSKGGLSAEHVEQPPPKEEPEAEGKLRVDEDSSVTARFYVHQILSLNEENIRNTWSKISRHPGGAAERDLRMEQLIWRVWALKRRHAGVQEAKKQHQFEEQGAFVPPAFTEHEADTTTRMTIDELNALEREAIEAQRQGEGTKGAGMDTLQEQEEVPEAKSDVSWEGVYSKAKPSGQSKAASPFASQKALDQMTGNLSSMSGSDIVQDGVRHAPPSSGTNAIQPDTLLVSRFPRLYLVLISLHGLVRGERMELGRDPDTGGQIKYVVEVAKALARIPSVARVDLLTRRICDPSVDASYGKPEEPLKLPPMGNQPAVESGADGGMGGAYIVRLPCGPTNVYLKKEDLWPHIREFADNAIAHTTNTLAKLQEGKEGPCELYTIHGHYADAGEVAALMAHTLGVECVLTGHSLGRNKREHLLKSGTIDYKEMEATYRISRRIEAEERALDAVSCVFTSTGQEVAEQWGTYDGYSDQLSAALQLRPCRGYHVPRMAVIPPGLDFSNLKVSMPNDPWEMVLGPNYNDFINSNGHREAFSGHGSRTNLVEGELELSPKGQQEKAKGMKTSGSGNALSSTTSQSGSQQEKSNRLKVMAPTALGKSLFGPDEPAIWKQIGRFLRHPGKPVILAMSRPDAKKNVTALVKAYGSSRVLRDLANLVLVLGNRDIIDGMAPGSSRVMNEVLKLIDAYDLYGSVAYPKKHSQSDISDIYLLAAATHGVFVNPALQEPFGLTLIEAAAHGVPTVATTHGGPVDIVATLHNGVLVEPTDVAAIRDSLISIITSAKSWEQYSESGRRNITAYSWPSHCARYLHTIEDQKATSESEGAIRLHGFAPGGPVSGDHRHMQRTLSLTYDDLGNLARTIAGSRNANSVDVIGDAVTNIMNPQGKEQGQSHPGGSEKASQSASNAASTARDEEEKERSSASTMLRAGSMPPVAASTENLTSDAEGQRGNRYRSGTLQISTRRSGHEEKPRSASAVRVRGDGTIQKKESSKGQDSFSRLANQLIPATPEARHEHFMVLCVDSMTDMEAAAALIKDSLAKGASNGPHSMHCNLLRKIAGVSPQGELGVGIMCNWTCKDARTVLKQQGVNEKDLAFFVCNAGSLVWHTNMDKDSSAQGAEDKPTLTCDEQWEQHINFRWDSRVVQQVLQRIIDSDVGWGKLAIARDAGDGKTQPAATTSVSMKLSPQSSPLHLMVEVEVLGAVHNPSATPTKAGAQRQPLSLADVGLQLLGAFRRKLRMSGVRAQCVVSPQDLDINPSSTPSASSTKVVLHITPLRCSRALAMRHLAFRFKRPMESAFTVVTFTAPQVPGASTASGSASDLVPVEAVFSPERKIQVSEGAASPMLLALRCSDGEDLVGGVQRVVLLPSAHSVASAAGSSQQPQAVPSVCFTVDAGVYTPQQVSSKDEAQVEAAAKQPASRVIVVKD